MMIRSPAGLKTKQEKKIKKKTDPWAQGRKYAAVDKDLGLDAASMVYSHFQHQSPVSTCICERRERLYLLVKCGEEGI